LKFIGDEPETEKTDSRQDAKANKFEEKKEFFLRSWRLGAITFLSPRLAAQNMSHHFSHFGSTNPRLYFA
jgi:hypothetical protein